MSKYLGLLAMRVAALRPVLRWILAPILLGAAMAFPVAAQAGKPPLLELGAKGGLALASYFWTGDAGWNESTMFVLQGEALIAADLKLSPTFGVTLEAGYHGKGCSVDASDGYAHWYLDYFELPVWAKWSERTENSILYGGIGGYAAWFLGGRHVFSTGVPGLDGSGGLSAGVADDPTIVKPFDYGALFLVGGGSRGMRFELRFSVGAIPCIEFTPPASFGSSRACLNSGFDLLVGYSL